MKRFKILKYVCLIWLLCGQLNAIAQSCGDMSLTASAPKVCVDNSIELVASGVPVGSNYTWTFGNQIKNDNTDSVKFIALTVGNVSPSLLIKTPTNLTCKLTLENNGVVAVKGKPKKLSLQVTPGNTLCKTGELVTIEAKGGTSDLKYTYLLETHGSTSLDYLYRSESAKPSVTTRFYHEGYKKVTLELKNADGCVTNIAFDSLIGVGALQDPSFTVSDPKTCDRKEVDLTNNSQGTNTTYSWSFPGANPSSSILPEPKGVTYSKPGSYTIKLEIANDFGCKKTFEMNEAVVVGAPRLLDLQIDKSEVCINEPFTVTQKSTGIVAENLEWLQFGAIVNSTQSTISKRVLRHNKSGVFDIGLRYDDGGCITEFIYQDTITVAEVSSSFRQDVSCACKPGEVNFINLSAGDALDYEWRITDEFDNLVATSTDEDFTYDFKKQGAFKVALTVTSQSTGCTSTNERRVTFKDLDADFIVTSEKICIGEKISAILDEKATCPDAIDDFLWTVYDQNGKAIFNKNLPDFYYELLTPGIYSLGLKISNNEGCEDEIIKKDIIEIFELESKISTAEEFVCANDTVDLEASNGPYPVSTTNSWLIIDPTTKVRFTGVGTSLQFPLTTPGVYDVYLYTSKNPYCADTVFLKEQYKVSGAMAEINTGKRASCVPFDDRAIAKVTKNIYFQGGSDKVEYKWFSDQNRGIEFLDSLNDTTQVRINQSNTYGLGIHLVNSDGCETSFQDNISYEAGVVSSFGINSVACTDVPLTVANRSFLNPTSFKWSIRNQDNHPVEVKPGLKARSPKFTFSEPGLYEVTLNVENDLGCVDSFTRAISVIDFNYDFGTPDSASILCAPALVRFDVQSTNVDSFYWIFGDGDALGNTGDGVAHLYDILDFDPANIYKFDVSLVAISKHGCFDTLSKADYIQLSGPRPKFILEPREGTHSQEVTFYNLSDAVDDFSFDFGDQTTAVDDSIPKHTYYANDTSAVYVEYTPFMVARDSRGCSRRFDDGPVRIYNASIPRFDVDTFEACENISLTFNNYTSFADSFRWFLNDDTSAFSTDRNPYISLPVGEHSVTLKTYNVLGEESSLTKDNLVVVYKNPTVRMTTEFDFYCSDTEVQFEDLSFGDKPIVSRVWDFSPNRAQIDTSERKIAHWTYTTTGEKSIGLEVTDAFGCTAQKIFADTVKVDEPTEIKHRGLSFVSHRAAGVLSTRIGNADTEGTSGFLLLENKNGNETYIQPIATPMDRYLDTGYYEFRPKSALAHYQLMGINDCRDTVAIGPLHLPVHLEVEANAVGFLPGIRWSHYEGWTEIDSYFVFRGTDIDKAVKIASVPGDSTYYLDREVCDNDYEYFVQVYHADEARGVRSNRETHTPDYTAPFGSSELFTTTVTEEGHIKTNWNPHPHPQVNRYLISRTDPNFGFIERHAIVSDTFYVDSIDVFIDRDIYQYEITGIDFCDNRADVSTVGNSIVLTSERIEDHLDITWNPFVEWPANETEYTLERAREDQVFEPLFSAKGTTSFRDDEVFLFEDQITKYRVKATYGDRVSYSNTILELPDLKVYIPNAFSPNNDGINDVYKVIGSGGLNGQEALFDNFRLVILNRWGQIVFESNDIYEGWDGSFKGELSPVGTYVYHVEFRDKRGRFQYHKGNLTLIN